MRQTEPQLIHRRGNFLIQALSTGLPLAVALVALATLILAPFWAYQWYRTPFIGAFLEPNLVTSQIGASDWPARQAGVQWSGRLVAVDGQPVDTPAAVSAILRAKGFEQVTLTFERRAGDSYQVTLLPRPVQPTDLFFQFLIPYLVGVILLLSGLWVYALGRGQLPARAFLLFTATASITTGAFLDMNTTHHMVLGWTLSLPFAAGSLVHLALIFPQRMGFVERAPNRRFLHWLIALPVGLYGLLEIVAPSSPWGYIQAWLWGYIYNAAAIVFFLSTLFVRVFRSPSPLVRQQSRIIVFGAILAFGPLLLLYLIPSMLGQQPVFQAAFYFPPFVVLLLSVAYAIVRYRLFDIDRILSSFVTYFLVSAVALGAFYLILSLLSFLLQERLSPTHPLLAATYLFLLVLALNPLRNLAQKTIDRIFYRTPADYRRVLSVLSREMIANPDLRQTIELLVRELRGALNPERVLLYLVDEDRQFYLPYGDLVASAEPLPAEDALVRLLHRLRRPVWFPPGEPYPAEITEHTPTDLSPTPQQLDCPVFAPLYFQNQLIGFLALGRRRSGEGYTRDDLEFLEAVAGQSTLALENVRLFANVQRTLEETRQMKNLMDDIFTSIASGVMTIDRERKVTLVNQAAQAILGAAAADILGSALSSAFPEMSAELDALVEAALENGRSTIGKELSPVLPGRGPVHLRLSAAPLKDARQETIGVTLVIDDLTIQRTLEAERELIHRTFGRVVAPRVRDRLLSVPTGLRLDGARQEVTVLFVDIHGFTSLGEVMEPEALFDLLNSYLSRFAQAIQEEEGTLDKFLGDGVIALWNAPDAQADHTLRAARAALAIRQSIQAYHATLRAEYQLTFSIGVTRGEAMVGNVGTSELFNYTAIGDMVNLAQRIESVAEPGQILLSEAAYQAIARCAQARRLPPLTLRGRRQEVVVYELFELIPGGET